MIRCYLAPNVQKYAAAPHIGPPQVKCRLLISSIFDAMNFQHFLEMLEIIL